MTLTKNQYAYILDLFNESIGKAQFRVRSFANYGDFDEDFEAYANKMQKEFELMLSTLEDDFDNKTGIRPIIEVKE